MKSDLVRRQDVLDIVYLDPGISETNAKMIKELPTIEPLTNEDYIELCDRFGGYVALVVQDMVEKREERWGWGK